MIMKHMIPAFLRRLSVGGILAGLVCAGPAFAAEDQWYDPTDWFDGNNIESDDTFDGYYDYSYDYDYNGDWNDYDVWGEDNWDADYYDSNYWDRYDWNDSTRTASSSTSSTTGSSTSGSTAGSGTSGSSGSTAQSGSGSTPGDAVVYTYVLFAEPVSGQQTQSGQQTRSGQGGSALGSSGKQSGAKQSGQIARFNGTIEGLKTVNLQRRSGATGQHTIAKIKLDNGKTTIVSLGRSSQLQNLNLQAGDKVQAVGRRGMIDGETVFVAHSLRAKGQTIAANPAIRLGRTQTTAQAGAQSQQQGQSQAGAMTGSTAGQAQASLQGEVERVSRVSAGQNKNQHTLVEIKLENGQTSTVDFGPAASLEKIGLEEGDEITVRGRRSTVGGREVIVADLLKVDGEKVSSVSR
jgi:hypothetical protein